MTITAAKQLSRVVKLCYLCSIGLEICVAYAFLILSARLLRPAPTEHGQCSFSTTPHFPACFYRPWVPLPTNQPWVTLPTNQLLTSSSIMHWQKHKTSSSQLLRPVTGSACCATGLGVPFLAP